MRGLRYSDLRPLDLYEMTSLTAGEFKSLLEGFEEEFRSHMSEWTIEGKPRRKRSYSTYKNCPLLTAEDRLLFVISYLKHNPLQVLHGRLFGMPQGKTNMWLHILLSVLAKTFSRLGHTPSRSIEELNGKIQAKADPPLFVMTEPSDPSHVPKILLNRKASIAERKSATPSKTSSS